MLKISVSTGSAFEIREIKTATLYKKGARVMRSVGDDDHLGEPVDRLVIDFKDGTTIRVTGEAAAGDARLIENAGGSVFIKSPA